MISRIEGDVVAVLDDRIELRCGAVTYEILMPVVEQQRLAGSVGQRLEIYTLHQLEGQAQGTTFTPRLMGFSSVEQRAFFELLTTVKGLGSRKVLRAMQLDHDTIARAIASKDVTLLVSLPEIGKRTAETMVAALSGKVDRFIELKPAAGNDADGAHGDARAAMMREALAAMVQLGETRPNALQLIERAFAADPTIESTNVLITAAFRLRD